MKLNLYAVLDEKTEAYFGMFYMQFHGQAIREFGDICRNPKSRIGVHPEDYHLYCLGIFDDESGQTESHRVPQLLSRGSEYVNNVKLEQPNLATPMEEE